MVVGTSAGGLAALRAYLRGLPQEGPRLCHIIAQHMAPRHRSRLAELLAPFTVQPVVDLEDGQTLAEGTLYIMPPGARLSLDREGRVHLSQEENPPSPSPNINDLLHQCLGFAPQLGVAILSGTGHDGLAGAREVAAAGGVVVSEGAAEYPQMPGAIQTTGLSRFTAPPGELARYLVAALSGRLDETQLAHLSPWRKCSRFFRGTASISSATRATPCTASWTGGNGKNTWISPPIWPFWNGIGRSGSGWAPASSFPSPAFSGTRTSLRPWNSNWPAWWPAARKAIACASGCRPAPPGTRLTAWPSWSRRN